MLYVCMHKYVCTSTGRTYVCINICVRTCEYRELCNRGTAYAYANKNSVHTASQLQDWPKSVKLTIDGVDKVRYTVIPYEVPLREVPRGVAQERTNARMKYLHTC